jgi:hypothetical protein
MQKERVVKLKIEPYRGPNQEVIEGKHTLIKLYDDRLDYVINYKYIGYYEKPEDDVNFDEIETVLYEKGTVKREYLVGIFQKIDTVVTQKNRLLSNIEPEKYEVHNISIEWNGNCLQLSCEHIEDWNNTYKTVYNYIHNIKTEDEQNNAV